MAFLSAPDSVATESASPEIFGTVLDATGEPLEGAIVEAMTTHFGSFYARNVKHETRSRADGSFRLPVYFGKIPYLLKFSHRVSENPSDPVIPAAGEAVIFRFRDQKTYYQAGTILNGETGEGEAGAKLAIDAEYSDFVWSAESDEEGNYRFPYHSRGGNLAFYARKGDRVTPAYNTVGEYIELALGEGGTITGRVTEEGTGNGIPDATVTIRGYFRTFSTTTDSSGNYRFERIPPLRMWTPPEIKETYYNEYRVEVSHDHYVDLEDRRRLAKLEPGGVAEVDFQLVQNSTFTGTVTDPHGNPEPGAIVMVQYKKGNEPLLPSECVRTDKHGRYTLRSGESGRVNGYLSLGVYSENSGRGERSFEGLTLGETYERIDIQIGGTIEIKGTVHAPDGTPLPNVKVESGHNTFHFRYTDAEGRFDFGILPLEPKIQKPPRLTFLPSRPTFCFGQGGSSREHEVNPPIPPGTTFYHHKRCELSIAAPVHDVSVTLEPAEWITLKGALTDSEGLPVDKGTVFLFAGNPTDDHWTQIFSGTGLTRPGQNDYRELYFAYTKEGAWEMPIVLENKADYRSAYHWIDSSTGYSLGALGREGDKALLLDIVLSANVDGKHFDIQLGEPELPKRR